MSELVSMASRPPAASAAMRSPLAELATSARPKPAAAATAHAKMTRSQSRASRPALQPDSASSADGASEALKHFVYDGGYVKLREVALAYSLPQPLINRLGFIRGIDVALTGRNLWIIHKNLPFADPEQGQASGNASIGFQNAAFPSMRTFAFNLKLKF